MVEQLQSISKLAITLAVTMTFQQSSHCSLYLLCVYLKHTVCYYSVV